MIWRAGGSGIDHLVGRIRRAERLAPERPMSDDVMANFLLTHRHEAEECADVVAAWSEFAGPLCGPRPHGSCAAGGHRLWWTVKARDERAALSLLPAYVAQRTIAGEIRSTPYPREEVVHSPAYAISAGS